MTARIHRKTCSYYVDVDGLAYKVNHSVWTVPSGPRAGQLHHDWGVLGSQGCHSYTRWLDPHKPTHARVVEALKSVLTEAELSLGAPELVEA